MRSRQRNCAYNRRNETAAEYTYGVVQQGLESSMSSMVTPSKKHWVRKSLYL